MIPQQTSNSALIIFAKAPIPGTVKTRLCPPLTADEAASLHGSLVLDAIERAKDLPGATLYLAGAPDLGHPFFKTVEGRYRVRLLAQRGEDLGARMLQALKEAFALGHEPVLLTGTDLPSLPRVHLKAALEEVTVHDLVLGPTEDGGYYLIGLRRYISNLCPTLFEGIPWSTPSVLAETRKKAEAAGLTMSLLPACRDLDDLDDLKAFIKLAGRDEHISKRTEGALRLLESRLKNRTTTHN